MFLDKDLIHMKRKLGLLCILCLMACSVEAQFIYGTTGLLHMPTADMQKDKTFMAGGGHLNKHATPSRWNYNTWNYYILFSINCRKFIR